MTTTNSQKKRLKENGVQILFKSGLLRLPQRVHRNYLTVLNYHRIGDEGIDNFKPNISATPQAFAEQMELVSQWFNVVSLTDVIAWQRGNRPLPTHAALITFDDGYLDNYSLAFPILRQHGFPAIIFLTTDHIGTDTPFFWDLIAYSIYRTKLDHITIPKIGTFFWEDLSQVDMTILKITEIVKRLPQNEIRSITDQIPERLGVSIPHNTFANLMMSWEQIRELNSKGIDFGGHTMTHPILTQISSSQARSEIEGSKKKIEAEIDEQITSFAYPNGQAGDFNTNIIDIVGEAEYQTAFSLVNGLYSYKLVKNAPYEIRRIFISHKDTLSRFAFKVCGINRLSIFK